MADQIVFDFVTSRVYLQTTSGVQKAVEAPVVMAATPAPPTASSSSHEWRSTTPYRPAT
jgi:hypothetical protein